MDYSSFTKLRQDALRDLFDRKASPGIMQDKLQWAAASNNREFEIAFHARFTEQDDICAEFIEKAKATFPCIDKVVVKPGAEYEVLTTVVFKLK